MDFCLDFWHGFGFLRTIFSATGVYFWIGDFKLNFQALKRGFFYEIFSINIWPRNGGPLTEFLVYDLERGLFKRIF